MTQNYASFILVKQEIHKQSIMLSTSTSNSSFLNGSSGEFSDDRIQILDCENVRDFNEPMSQSRKICFISSIVTIIVMVLIFLFLPCQNNCSSDKNLITRNWIKSYEKLEFKGDINIVLSQGSSSSPSEYSKNLVFMYRVDKIFPSVSSKKNKPKKSGVIALSGSTGEVTWSNEMTNEPRTIDCELIDCDKSGTKDCLVLDEYGQLACIDGSGHWIYYKPNQKATKQTRHDLLDFPLILPDLDGDKVNEIMMSSSNGKPNSTDLIVISGANGKLLLKEPQNCTYLHKLQIDSEFVIKFICMIKEDTEQQLFRNLTDLYQLMSKKPLNLKKLQPVSKINQHKYYGKRSTTTTQQTITTVNDKELIVENKGTWPRDCKASIQLNINQKGIKRTLWSKVYSNVYAMVPTALSLNGSSFGNRRNENIHGFVIKMWIWNGTEISYNIEKNRFGRDGDEQLLKRAMKSQQSNNQTSNSGYKTKVRFLKENILLIAFNSTNSTSARFENTSQSTITQFCQRSNFSLKNSDDDFMCQPDMNYQENSLLITDIDDDGSKELVSYFSTFQNDENSEHIFTDNWKLKTNVFFFKLESELPKLYAGDLDMY